MLAFGFCGIRESRHLQRGQRRFPLDTCLVSDLSRLFQEHPCGGFIAYCRRDGALHTSRECCDRRAAIGCSITEVLQDVCRLAQSAGEDQGFGQPRLGLGQERRVRESLESLLSFQQKRDALLGPASTRQRATEGVRGGSYSHRVATRPPDPPCLSQSPLCFFEAALLCSNLGDVVRALRYSDDVSGAASRCHALLEARARIVPSSGLERVDASIVEHGRQAGKVPELLVDGLRQAAVLERLIVADLTQGPGKQVVGVRLGGAIAGSECVGQCSLAPLDAGPVPLPPDQRARAGDAQSGSLHCDGRFCREVGKRSQPPAIPDEGGGVPAELLAERPLFPKQPSQRLSVVAAAQPTCPAQGLACEVVSAGQHCHVGHCLVGRGQVLWRDRSPGSSCIVNGAAVERRGLDGCVGVGRALTCQQVVAPREFAVTRTIEVEGEQTKSSVVGFALGHEGSTDAQV